jgi:hypothetical protein
LLSRAARLLGGFVVGALPGFVLLAGPSIVTGDVAYSVLLPAAFAIALLALPVAAWAVSRRDRPALAVWALVGVLLGVLFSLAVWLALFAMAAGSFSFTPGKQSGLSYRDAPHLVVWRHAPPRARTVGGQ